MATEEFIKSINGEQFYYLNHLPIIYEALANYLDNWAGFFLNELNRLFVTAGTEASPQQVLTHFDELSFINALNFKHRDAFVTILSNELDNKDPAFRYYAISLLSDFIQSYDLKTVNKLKICLEDVYWRVRYSASMALKDLNKLSNNYSLSFLKKSGQK